MKNYANGAAHKLAKETLNHLNKQVHMEETPSWIHDIVLAEHCVQDYFC